MLTSGELEHSANRDTLLLPSIASRSIRAATSNSSCSKQKTKTITKKKSIEIEVLLKVIQDLDMYVFIDSDLFRISIVNSISFRKRRSHAPISFLYVNKKVQDTDVHLITISLNINMFKTNLNGVNTICRYFPREKVKSFPVLFKCYMPCDLTSVYRISFPMQI